MLIVFHKGISLKQYLKMLVINLIEEVGGKIYVPRAMYSFSTSFWMVPFSLSGEIPCFSATAMYMAKSTVAGAFMVIEVLTLSRGIPLNNISISFKESIATPTFPTSPNDIEIGRASCRE